MGFKTETGLPRLPHPSVNQNDMGSASRTQSIQLGGAEHRNKVETYRFALKGLSLLKGKVEEIIIWHMHEHVGKHLKGAITEVRTAARSRLVLHKLSVKIC